MGLMDRARANGNGQENDTKNESTTEDAAATCVAATAKTTAVANALKAEREDASGRKDPNSPLSPGRLAWEAVWHQHMQPQRWDHLHPVGDVPKGYVNPIPWIGVVQPKDWHEREQAVDENGIPMFDTNGQMILTWVNPLRIRHPLAVFMGARRLQMYQDLVLAAAEPKFMVLWSIHILEEPWIDAEHLMLSEPYWWNIYREEFGCSDEEALEATGITSHDGTGEPSGAGPTPTEA